MGAKGHLSRSEARVCVCVARQYVCLSFSPPDKPYHVKAPNGALWWYMAEAVRLAEGSAGEWREVSSRKTCCSRLEDLDGAICLHGADATHNHWSCCGLESPTAACSNVRQ